MGLDAINNAFTLHNVLNLGIKFFGVLGTFMYLIFTIVLIRQIRMMKETVLVKDGGLLLLLGYAQVGVAFLLILYSFFL